MAGYGGSPKAAKPVLPPLSLPTGLQAATSTASSREQETSRKDASCASSYEPEASKQEQDTSSASIPSRHSPREASPSRDIGNAEGVLAPLSNAEDIRPSASRNSESSSVLQDVANVIGARSQIDPHSDRQFLYKPLTVDRREVAVDSRDRFGKAAPDSNLPKLSLRGVRRWPNVELPTWDTPRDRTSGDYQGSGDNANLDPLVSPVIGRRVEYFDVSQDPPVGRGVPVSAATAPTVLPVPVSAAVAEAVGSVSLSHHTEQIQNALPSGWPSVGEERHGETNVENLVTAQTNSQLETGQSLPDGAQTSLNEAQNFLPVSWPLWEGAGDGGVAVQDSLVPQSNSWCQIGEEEEGCEEELVTAEGATGVGQMQAQHENTKLLQPDDSCAHDEHHAVDVHLIDVRAKSPEARTTSSSKRCYCRACCGAKRGSCKACCRVTPRQVCCSCMPTLKDFPCCVVHCPFLFAAIVLLSIPAYMGLLWPGIEINTDFDSFLEADSHANEVRASYMAALKWRTETSVRRLATVGGDQLGVFVDGTSVWEKPRRLSSEPPALDPEILHKINALKFIYRAKDGSNVISPGMLREISSFEIGLRSGKWWKKLCLEFGNLALASACEPGVSFVNFVFPEPPAMNDQNSEELQYKLNGRGSAPLPLRTTMEMVEREQLREMFYPKDHVGDGMGASLLRSFFEFNMICCTMYDSAAYERAQLRVLNQHWETFLSEELYPAIVEFKENSASVDILFGGGGIDSHEVWLTLMSDASMAIGSMSFILAFLTFHTRSICLSLGALLLTIISIPVAFVTSANVSGSNEVTGASFLSLFLIVGLGADVVLVFISFWEMSKDHYDKTDRPRRLRYLYNNAGVSCLATTMTTAASFFANLASVLRPLREFGFFMGLCISLAYVFLLTGYPAVLVMDECLRDSLKRCFGRIRGKIQEGDHDLPESPPESPKHLPNEAQLCMSCGATLASDVEVCQLCGAAHFLRHQKRVPTCASCGQVLELDAKLCQFCGAAHVPGHEEQVVLSSDEPFEDEPGVQANLMGRTDSQGTGKFRSSWYQRCLDFYILRVLVPNRWKVFLFSIVVPFGAMYLTYLEAEVNATMPEIFPPGHNANDLPEARLKFKSTFSTWPDVDVNFCTVDSETPAQNCMFNYCQMRSNENYWADPLLGWWELDGSAACMCDVLQESGQHCDYDRGLPINLLINSRFIGAEYVPDSFWTSEAWIDHVKGTLRKVNGWDDPRLQHVNVTMGTAWKNLSGLFQEDWERGSVTVRPFLSGPSMMFTVPSIASVVYNKSGPRPKAKLCGALEVCYCGAPACSLTGGRRTLIRSEGDSQSNVSIHAGPMPAQQDVSGSGESGRRMAVEQGQKHITHVGKRPCRYTKDGACPSSAGANEANSGSLASAESWRWPQLPHQWQARRLLETTDLNIVWGLKVTAGTKLLGKAEDIWGFDLDFRGDTPSAQRHMVRTCEQARKREDLRVISSMCWIEDFKNHLPLEDELFPVRSSRFSSLLQSWAEMAIFPDGSSVKGQMFLDEFGQLVATLVRFDVAVSYERTPASKILAYQVGWDEFMGDKNREAPPGLDDGWHTSRLWIRAEAEQAILGSTLNTLSVSAGCGFFGALSFTHGDLALALMVVLCVLGVTTMLAFFMTVIMGWGYGAIEVLGLIVFVGYSITYSLHIAHKYREHTRSGARDAFGADRGSRWKREGATVYALQVMTTAVLGSAVTTLGSAFFLFFCTMRIFVKLAAILFAVTFFAAVFAVVVLPSALLCIGPLGFCGLGPIAERFGKTQIEPESAASMQRLLSNSSKRSEEDAAKPPKSPKSPRSPRSSPRASGERQCFGAGGERARHGSDDSLRAASRPPKSEVFISAMDRTMSTPQEITAKACLSRAARVMTPSSKPENSSVSGLAGARPRQNTNTLELDAESTRPVPHAGALADGRTGPANGQVEAALTLSHPPPGGGVGLLPPADDALVSQSNLSGMGVPLPDGIVRQLPQPPEANEKASPARMHI